MNVLVQIRDDGLREDVVEVARGAGWATHEARTPDEVAVRLEECGARALVLEVHDRDGLDDVRRLAADVAVVAIGHEPGLEQRVAVLRHGARAFLRKPFAAAALEHALIRAVPREGPLPGREESADDEFLIARDSCTKRLLARLESAANSDATVRIVGESGTGKLWLARHLHRRSARSRGPLVVVSCAGLSAPIAKRELFGRGDVAPGDPGHGRVSAARGGTLVLAHVDELPPALEPALLRLLLEREPDAAGAGQGTENARIVATARGEAASRSAVVDRLDVITLRVPPLRERPADLPILAEVLLSHFARLAG
ncbi:MAG: sigma-54-dependent transcriptional regulator, partial [Miltoncostaeaceae bacterium]